MQLLVRILFSILLLASPTVGNAADRAEIFAVASPGKVYTFRWNPVQGSRDGIDSLRECLNASWCKAAAKKAAEIVGISGEVVEVIHVYLVLTASKQGEEHRRTWKTPSGHKVCTVNVKVVSWVRSTLGVTVVGGRELRLYSFVKKGSVGTGRSWVDAIVTVSTVPTKSKARCTNFGSKKVVFDKRHGA